MKRIFILIFISLSGCSTFKTEETALPSIQAPVVAPLNLGKIQWQVLNNSIIKELAENLRNKNITLYSLDSVNYPILDANLLELQRYIQEQDQVIKFYQQLENNKLNQPTGH